MADTSSNSLRVGKPVAAETSGVVEKNEELLDWRDDAYGGVMVELKESMDSEVFASLLRASMEHWMHQGKKGVWIKLPIELVNLVEVAVKQGFRYHHAEPSYLMLVKWIPKTADALPANASHRVGVGAFVMNDNGEVLVVQENSGAFKGTGVWKFPTGAVDEGEDVGMAAIREVKEETGIETEFVEVIAFRQSHKSFFGKSDIFFVCMLKPLSFNIQKQDSEIAEAKWMPFDEYATQPFVQKHEMFKRIANVCLEKKKNNYIGFSAGKKGVWIELPIELVNLVEVAVKQGFRYHHAEPSYLMLVKWIPKTADALPANASHRVGVGAFVMNNIGEVLVVQENSGAFKGTGVRKFPTGAIDEGEDVGMAAIREVKEETGIETEFVEVIAFRQSHKSFFGKSDIFFVCMLKPLSFNIQKQDSEIAEAKWMPFDEYATQPFVQKHEMFKRIANVCLEKKKNNYIGFSAVITTTGFSSKKSILYVTKDI